MDLRRRALSAAFCCLLVLLVGVERRLAEVHLNRASAAPAFENEDLLDGDEIRVRLTLVAEEDPQPDLPGAPLAWAPPPPRPADALPSAPLRWSSSRSPPRSRPTA